MSVSLTRSESVSVISAFHSVRMMQKQCPLAASEGSDMPLKPLADMVKEILEVVINKRLKKPSPL